VDADIQGVGIETVASVDSRDRAPEAATTRLVGWESTMMKQRNRLLSLLLVGMLACGSLLTVSTGSADAMNPPQSTVTGTVNTLYWKLQAFWRWYLRSPGLASPTVDYYNTSSTYVPSCSAYLSESQMMAYCWGPKQIWVHTGVNQSKIDRLRDYAAGFWLAHEWGHHIANELNLDYAFSTRGGELYADCMAGVFTRYAVGWGWLDGWDYWEAIWSIDDYYPFEGGFDRYSYPRKADRKNFYNIGYHYSNNEICRTAAAGW
jgi:predicted metalloprotease